MATITVQLPDELYQNLQQLAERYNLTVPELVQAMVEQMVLSSPDSFNQSLAYVLHKNQELYQRLGASSSITN